MSEREKAIQLLERVPEKKLYYIIGILEGALIPEVEEVDADEWDLKMINEAKRENDGEEVTLEELKKELDKKTQERLLRAISQLPMGTDIKKLQGLEMYRMRVGDMRVLYTIDDVVMVISIENIDNRGDVYKRL